ncbi:MAG: hypothetical protein AAGA56_13265, partial [Myxococcota bacterium]
FHDFDLDGTIDLYVANGAVQAWREDERFSKEDAYAEPNHLFRGGYHETRPWLLQLGSIIVQDRGIVTFVHMLAVDVEGHAMTWRRLRRELDEQIHDKYPNVFSRVDVVDDKYRAAVQIAQAYGVGSLEANTIMLGWPRQESHREGYVRMLRELSVLERSLLIVSHNPLRKLSSARRDRRIDIWWGGLQGNGGLMLLVAYLITAHHNWTGAKVTIRTVVDREEDRLGAVEAIEGVLRNARVLAQPVVLLREGRAIADIMHAESRDADLAIAGLRLPRAGVAVNPFFERMNNILHDLPTTILVHSARGFESESVLFDEGASSPKAEEAAQ